MKKANLLLHFLLIVSFGIGQDSFEMSLLNDLVLNNEKISKIGLQSINLKDFKNKSGKTKEKYISFNLGVIYKYVNYNFVDESGYGGNIPWADFDSEKTSMFSNAYGLNYQVKFNRFVIQNNFCFNRINLDYYGTVNKLNVEGFVSTSSISFLHYFSQKDYTTMSLGLAFQIFNPKSKFNVIPMIENDFVFKTKKKILIDEYSKEQVQHNYFPGNQETFIYTYSEGKASEFIADLYSISDNYYYSNFNSFSFYDFSRNMKVGFMFQYSFIQKLVIQLGASKFLRKLNYFDCYGVKERRKYQFTFGILYKIK